MNYLFEALDLFHQQEKENIEILIFGKFSGNDKILSFKIHNFGFINNNQKLMEIFTLADIFVGPSIEESFGNVFLEALSCGTPCVSFNDIGAATDIINHKKNGYIAESMNSYDLFQGIKWTLNNSLNLKDNCISTVKNKFLLDDIVNKYIEVYK
jgi:glycosyltransferase involved in cell wall biosynthesis